MESKNVSSAKGEIVEGKGNKNTEDIKKCSECNIKKRLEDFRPSSIYKRGDGKISQYYQRVCRPCEIVANENRTKTYKLNRLCATGCGRPLVGTYKCQYHIDKTKQNYQELKQQVLDHYGNQCNCCGESQYEFLTFDHINNDGFKQRKQYYDENKRKKGGASFISMLGAKNIRSGNFPIDIQILCWNCNCAKGFFGFCPHQTDKITHLNTG